MSVGIIMKSDGEKTLDQIKAEVAAFEANPVDPGAPDIPTQPEVTAAAPVEPSDKAATPKPVTPQGTEPAKPDQQPKEVAASPAPETPKAAEPVKDWEAAYKGLQAKYNKRFVEEKAGAEPKQEQPVVEAPKPIVGSILSPESKQQFAKDVETDPVEAIVRLVKSITDVEVSPIRSKFEQTEAERLEAARIKSLQALVDEGHEWIKTSDGVNKMEQVLAQNPELWRTKDPYRAALGFIPDVPSKARQGGPAQSTGLTPMLGASGAVPPASSAPAVSKMEKLESLQKEVALLQSRGQWSEATAKLKEMDDIERGWK